jgi:TM2 domain-containing membrane protein YozV
MDTMKKSMVAFGLPVNESAAFSTPKGEFKERLQRQQLKMLEDYVPLLRQFLEPDEEIQLAMQGCSPTTTLEQLTTGWIIAYIKRCILVVTNKRILHFPAKGNFKPRHSIAQIRFGDVDEIKAGSFFGRRFTVKYKNGKKETFLYVREASRLKSLIPRLQLQGRMPTPARGRHHLCPKCTAPLTAGEYTCKTCGLEFKNEKKAVLISLVVPGGGYFYTNHPIMGIQDFLVESGLILAVAAMAIGAASSSNEVAPLVFFGILLALEKLYTVYHAKHYVREYIPVDKHVEPLRRP